MSALTCNAIVPAGSWDETDAVDSVLLDFNGRHRRRLAMTGEAGLSFLLDLTRAKTLRNGDGLVLGDGSIVRVKAAPEPLLEISGADLPSLVRIAWHLGNRHLPTQLLGDRLRIRDDHVIAAMAEGLGGKVVHVEDAFDPEGGAYGNGAGANHDHHHHHHHDHDDDNHTGQHPHEHEHGRGHPHGDHGRR